MNAIIKALVIFWLVLAPLVFVALMFGPAYAPKAEPYEEPKKCDAACMDELLAP